MNWQSKAPEAKLITQAKTTHIVSNKIAHANNTSGALKREKSLGQKLPLPINYALNEKETAKNSPKNIINPAYYSNTTDNTIPGHQINGKERTHGQKGFFNTIVGLCFLLIAFIVLLIGTINIAGFFTAYLIAYFLILIGLIAIIVGLVNNIMGLNQNDPYHKLAKAGLMIDTLVVFGVLLTIIVALLI